MCTRQHVQHYLDVCEDLHLEPEASIINTLYTEYHILTVHNTETPGSLLPILSLVQHHPEALDQVTELVVVYPQQVTNTDQYYQVDGQVLFRLFSELACKITTLRIANMRMDDATLQGIVSLVEHTHSLTHLHMPHCNMGLSCSKDATLEFVAALELNSTLEYLDVSNNWLGYDLMKEITNSMEVQLDATRQLDDHAAFLPGNSDDDDDGEDGGAEDMIEPVQISKRTGVVVEGFGNVVFEEVLNTLTHGIGAMLALVGSVVLMEHSSDTRRKFWSSLIYCSTLVILFSCSSLFHGFFLKRDVFEILQLLDHCAIYFLIAGSYMPFCVVALAESQNGIYVAMMQWSSVAFGICLTLYDHRRPLKYKAIVELVLYVLMGYMAVFFWDDMNAHVDAQALKMLLWGGYAYTFGIVFFLMERFHPIFHAIWHIFVLIGAGIHYFAILHHVVGMEELEASIKLVGKTEL